MLFEGARGGGRKRGLDYAPVILLHIVLLLSLPEETDEFHEDQVYAHSFIPHLTLSEYRKGQTAQIMLLMEHWESGGFRNINLKSTLNLGH